MTNNTNTVTYTGVTNNLKRRIYEHREKLFEGFTKRYSVHQLAWYELHSSMQSAIEREKRMKGWKRKWELELIESMNPKRQDLYHKIV